MACATDLIRTSFPPADKHFSIHPCTRFQIRSFKYLKEPPLLSPHPRAAPSISLPKTHCAQRYLGHCSAQRATPSVRKQAVQLEGPQSPVKCVQPPVVHPYLKKKKTNPYFIYPNPFPPALSPELPLFVSATAVLRPAGEYVCIGVGTYILPPQPLMVGFFLPMLHSSMVAAAAARRRHPSPVVLRDRRTPCPCSCTAPLCSCHFNVEADTATGV